MTEWTKRLVIASLLAILFACSAGAENPILPGYADPHLRVWDGKMYISVGKDRDPKMDRFYITNWSIFSSTDLVHWKLESVIDPADTHLGKGYEFCWASDITARDGKHFLYVSEHGDATSVFVADKPSGPYKDVLGKSFIPDDYSENHEYDPTIFIEDDGEQYIIFGRDGMLGKKLLHYQMAKLSDDMLSLDGQPQSLLTSENYGFGDANRARDHQYFHKHNGLYYLSCAGAYMTSTKRTGPFENMRHTGQDGHTSFSSYHGQDYSAHEYTCEPHGNRRYRQISLTYLHYKDNGDMVVDKDFLQDTHVAKRGNFYETGVAIYDANWERIEAEWFFRIANGKKKESPSGGFEIQQINNGAYLNFPQMKNMKKNATLEFLVSSESESTIEVRSGSPEGKLMGTCTVPNAESFKTYQNVSCSLNNEAGTHDVYLVFKGKAKDLLHLDSFRFE